jgi:hypothetical protein
MQNDKLIKKGHKKSREKTSELTWVNSVILLFKKKKTKKPLYAFIFFFSFKGMTGTLLFIFFYAFEGKTVITS